MVISENKVVSIFFEVKDTDGNILDSNIGYTPLEYIHGSDNIITGLEKEMEGLKISDNKMITITPDQGYGEYDHSLVYHLPLSNFIHTGFINIHDVIQLPDGREAVIIGRNESEIIADSNHPMAGKTLIFNVTVSGVRNATEEEIECGYPISEKKFCSGQPGCC